ncbi:MULTISPECIES: SGNH/GDSL hydrolase family protein [Microbacterium]|uniref:SGNH/GDSL hydrolase family protein n=1 Tax=Microbacterium TaxID=33882 RepID=UPI00217D7233|nr:MULTISPECIES: SGNH/GDSL hydrolase family protein [Microbacterium]UWF78264.1 SGNH/GDSL hydrolase family protein [Microbacterium neungamense]WCM56438.1 SGNH/GDSL hydrolase family protein [Microbacterium sp. EF45047]
MKLRARTRRRRTVLAAVGAAAVLVGVVLGVWRPWTPPVETPPIAAADAAVPPPAPLELPEHPTVLVFGDSWTFGAAATVPEGGYAYRLAELLDGETIVRGVSGSGYLRPGLPTFGERIAALEPELDPDLVIVQGSINDRREDLTGYAAAVNAAWDALARTYPEAAIVVLGPAPHELPVGVATARIDRELAALAAARGWWYISPVQEEWITDANYLDVIDVGIGRQHPSDAGHAFLAEKVAAALEDLRAAAVTAADEADPEPAK